MRDTLFRPDDATELLAMYWKDGKRPIAKAIQKGLAMFFSTLDAFRLAKYGTRDGAVKLRDVLFLSHAKPKDENQSALWKEFVAGNLAEPETWEHLLSAGKDKAETFTNLLKENKIGALALIRNLRNMIESGVDRETVRIALASAKTERIFPYQILTAARYAPTFEPYLEEMLFKCLAEYGKLSGMTIFLVDNSSSMSSACGGKKSEMTRFDAAVSLAVLLREVCVDSRLFLFNTSLREVPARRGFGLVQAMGTPSGGTRLGAALTVANQNPHDRIIVISDEQTEDKVPDPVAKLAYMINPASDKNGVGYGPWVHIDGFSTQVMDFVLAHEAG